MIDTLKTDLTFLPLHLGRNRIEHNIEPVDPTLEDRSGLRYYLDIYIPAYRQSPELERLLKLPGAEKPPLLKGGASIFEGAFFRLDELLNDALERTKPEFKQEGMSVIVSLTMPVELRESIENNGIVIPGSEITRPKIWIIKAGLNEEDFAGWGDQFFDKYLLETRSFLTSQPDGKVIGSQQEEYLYFLLNQSPAPASVKRRIEVTFEDLSTQTLDKGSLEGVGLYQVICAPMGPQALGLNSLPKRVRSYKVWLSNQANERLSEVRTYRIDPRYRQQERFILFSNSRGGWDTLRLIGEGSETLKTSRTLAEVDRPLGAALDFPEIKIVNLTGERELTVSTGWIERNAKQTLAYLDELLLSEELYIVTDKGHFPLDITTNSLLDSEDSADLISRTFTFKRTTPVQNFSALPAAPLSAARPTSWRGLGLVYMLDSLGKRNGRGRPIRLQKYYTDDNSLYKPRTEKPNIQGDPDFIADFLLPGGVTGSTPYPSAAITRETTYSRNNCGVDMVGGPLTISIPAGKYGGEAPGDADALAEAEYKAKNTQAYVNQYGTCTSAPELYQVAIPSGHWHFRANDPSRVTVHWWGGYAPTGATNHMGTIVPDIGNIWFLQGQTGPYILPAGANDLNFPALSNDWRFAIKGPAFSTLNLKIYRNGTLILNYTHTTDREGYDYQSFPPPANGDLFYFKLTTL
ncbi:DUF5977 domain-containing protein [Spirosoma sp.]|uniref:DUF5977 domain-containing protein n=1 Tax=Spirosoma sp. TaxID=1899569 RepID=UPI00262256FB|nr:DUF5977 domain-containing protein [Spirosoma sp.]MCX6216566.1 DUF5977 domain-containing protein [Spirosoma sp.]